MWVVCRVFLVIITSYGARLSAGADMRASYRFFPAFGILTMATAVASIIAALCSGLYISGAFGKSLATCNAIICIASFVSLFYGLHWQHKPLEAIHSQVTPLVARLAQDSPPMSSTRRRPAMPYLVVDASLDSFGNPLFDEHPIWRATSSVEDLLLDACSDGQTGQIINSIVLVGREWHETGRNVVLDVGSAPELRQRVQLLVVDVANWQIVWSEGPIIGGEARLPRVRAPGGGSTIIEALRGPEVPDRDIDKRIAQIPWE
jgi:hypothetical protein